MLGENGASQREPLWLPEHSQPGKVLLIRKGESGREEDENCTQRQKGIFGGQWLRLTTQCRRHRFEPGWELRSCIPYCMAFKKKMYFLKLKTGKGVRGQIKATSVLMDNLSSPSTQLYTNSFFYKLIYHFILFLAVLHLHSGTQAFSSWGGGWGWRLLFRFSTWAFLIVVASLLWNTEPEHRGLVALRPVGSLPDQGSTLVSSALMG